MESALLQMLIANAGHFLHLERSVEVGEVIAAFIEDQSSHLD